MKKVTIELPDVASDIQIIVGKKDEVGIRTADVSPLIRTQGPLWKGEGHFKFDGEDWDEV